MVRFLIDEDLPRSCTHALQVVGFDVSDVRDIGMRGRFDADVLEYTTANGRTVLTADVGFGNILRFPLGRHAGIVVARFPVQVSIRDMNAALLAAFESLSEEDFAGNVIVITPNQIRIRRASGM